MEAYKEHSKKLSQLFNKILNETVTPDECYNSITIPILKKGLKTCQQNYRGITLPHTVMNFFTSILKDKLETTGLHEGTVDSRSS